nr:hypothetical protein [Chloroflexota bacterium]
MFTPWHLVIWTPEETVLDAFGVYWIQVRLADGGEIGIWPGHAPLLAETLTAPVRYADNTGEHAVSIRAGILHIAPGQVSIYTTGLANAVTVPSEPGEEKQRGRLVETLLHSPQSSQR